MVTENENQIIANLHKVINGEPVIYEEIFNMAADTEFTGGKLSEYLQEAWYELSHWVNDDDIREKDPEYGKMKKEKMKWYIDEIEKLMKE